MGYTHPKDAFLAEGLNLVRRIVNLRELGIRPLYAPCGSHQLVSHAMRGWS